jgi:AraC-like DNA-binding protein
MPVLPIPMIIALLLLGLLIQRMASRKSHISILVLIAACAAQGAILAVVQYYGFTVLRPLQAIMAMFIPPIAWAAFITAAGGGIQFNKTVWHVVGPILAVASLVLKPYLLDALIPLSFAGYGIAMLYRLLAGEDSLLHARLDSGASAVWAWRIVGLSLIASALCDVTIAYGMATGGHPLLLWIPSVVSSLSLLSLGILSLSNAIESHRESDAETVSEDEVLRDQAIISALDTYLETHKPYLDPDLTLSRLARKLVIPAKQLSTAINRSKSENVSRFINRHRIEHACKRMAEGKSVTVAMFESGFNTKSNFNREFLRIKKVAPSKWLANT